MVQYRRGFSSRVTLQWLQCLGGFWFSRMNGRPICTWGTMPARAWGVNSPAIPSMPFICHPARIVLDVPRPTMHTFPIPPVHPDPSMPAAGFRVRHNCVCARFRTVPTRYYPLFMELNARQGYASSSAYRRDCHGSSYASPATFFGAASRGLPKNIKFVRMRATRIKWVDRGVVAKTTTYSSVYS